MELFGAISSGDQWRSNDLNGIYSSDHDHHDYHQFMSSDSDVPNYDLNHIGASSLEIPFTIWPSCDSTIVHDEPSGNYGALEFRSANMFLNIGCDDINHDWMNVNGQLQARDVSGEESNAGQSSQAHVVPQSRWESEMIALTDQPSIGLGSLSGSSKKRARSTIANDDQVSNIIIIIIIFLVVNKMLKCSLTRHVVVGLEEQEECEVEKESKDCTERR